MNNIEQERYEDSVEGQYQSLVVQPELEREEREDYEKMLANSD